jgi:hypothetical protein
VTIALHELHRRRLEATVQLVEESLERVERLIAERSGGSLKAVQNPFLPEDRQHLLTAIHELRSKLASFVVACQLKRRSVDLRQILNSELISAWVMLENCRPKRMKGYGIEFAESSSKALDEGVESLLEQLDKLRQLLG